MPEPQTSADDARAARRRRSREIIEADLPGLTRFAYGLAGNRTDAEDLVSTAIAGYLAQTTQIATPPAYLKRSIINIHLNQQRHSKLAQIPHFQPKPVLDLSVQAAQRTDVDAALSALTPLQRSVIILRYLEDYSVRQAADLLNKPEGSIRRISHDALAILRRSTALTSTDDPDWTEE